jgi:lipoprotein-releasing system ATP-binding protein
MSEEREQRFLTPPALLECRQLFKSFTLGSGGQVDILCGLDLQVPPSEILAITGASGVGKSTLLHVLGALEPPDSGNLLFRGEDVYSRGETGLAAFRNRRIGFVFQFHHLLPEFSALENAMMPALIAGESRRRAAERARELLEAVELGHRLGQRPGKLSGGEQQRVAIARALVMIPDLVLADEPTGNLDSVSSRNVYRLFRQLQEVRGFTAVLATHNSELAAGADRVLCMEEGLLRRSQAG